jgi:ribosomal 30S subunit maturation factor RimM
MFRTGELTKAHGIRGELVFLSDSGLAPEPDELLYLQLPGGTQLPHRVAGSRPAMAHGEDAFFVLFYGIDSRTKAESLKDAEVFSLNEPPEAEVPETEMLEEGLSAELQDCEDYRILDEAAGLEGRIEALEENPAHPILRARFKAAKAEVLIPAVDAYIIAVNHDDAIVYGRDLPLFIELADS